MIRRIGWLRWSGSAWREAALALLAFVPGLAWPQAVNREIPAVVVERPPVIDGVLDDECWSLLPSSDSFTDAELTLPVADDTRIWIGYDNERIYVAFHCFDSRPDRILAQETRRGSELSGEDRVRLTLNLFNSMRFEDENELDVNPLGTQNTDLAGGRAAKQEWEGVWQSAARIVEDGWTCEIAVPWSVFVRPASNGEPVTLGINFERYQARTQIRSNWSDIGRQRRLEYSGRWVGVKMPPVTDDKKLSFLAYTFGGGQEDEEDGRGGFDVRYKFTPQFTGVASYNPDFANIEGDVTSIDFSYTEKVADERRPFFLEGEDYFESVLPWYSPFLSIRIPGFDYGGKMYGRLGKGTDLGVLFTHSLGERADTVVNLRQNLSPYESVGMTLVNRLEEGLDHTALLVGGRNRMGDWYSSLGYGRSFDPTGDGERISTSLFWSPDNWELGGGWNSTSRNYLERDGYVSFQDERGWWLEGGHSKPWRTGPFREFQLSIEAWTFERQDGAFFQDGYSAELELRHANQLEGSIGWSQSRFEDNRDRVYEVALGYPANDKFRNVRLGYAWGRRAGEGYALFTPRVNWRFFGRLSVSLATEVLRLGEYEQQDILSVSYDLSRDQAVGGRLVRRDGETNWYLSFRRSGYGGTEYFVILGDPNTDTFRDRLVFKVVREF